MTRFRRIGGSWSKTFYLCRGREQKNRSNRRRRWAGDRPRRRDRCRPCILDVRPGVHPFRGVRRFVWLRLVGVPAPHPGSMTGVQANFGNWFLSESGPRLCSWFEEGPLPPFNHSGFGHLRRQLAWSISKDDCSKYHARSPGDRIGFDRTLPKRRPWRDFKSAANRLTRPLRVRGRPPRLSLFDSIDPTLFRFREFKSDCSRDSSRRHRWRIQANASGGSQPRWKLLLFWW